VNRQPYLLQVVAAAHPPCRFSGSLDRWQQQPDKDAYDRDYHQQLNQSKPTHLAKTFHGHTTNA
jgi:hypothetical protein